jgi:endonuclease/exonuclease/phosphatase family metal-dependent hydrolase
VALLVRSWNLFHGNAVPPERRAYLKEAVRLVSADAPDLVCLQEVPAWALAELERWSGMRAFGALAAPPTVGPLPSTAEIGRALTSIHHGLTRSLFSGQANAILARQDLRPLEQRTLVLNDRGFRRAQARWLGLSLAARLAWAKERRVCQAVRFALPHGGGLLLANLHATAYRPDGRLADAELLRGAVFADGLAEPDDVCVIAGDLNVRAGRSRTLADLAGPDWGFGGGGFGVDHILVRGAPAGPVEEWPIARRRIGGRVLSDHTPVEVKIG